MIEIRKTEAFSRWLDGLKDLRARVQVRIERLAMGNPCDVRPVGEGVSELLVHYGPGYRVNQTKRGERLISVLAGGDRGSQARDITRALRLAQGLSE